MNESCPARLSPSSQAKGRVGVSCSRCSLADMCLPHWLAETEIGELETLVHKSRPLHAGETLYAAGSPFCTVAVVRVGCFKSAVVTDQGEERILNFHFPGDLIGLDAIHDGHYVATTTALDTSVVCKLDFSSLKELARHQPGIQDALFDVMSLQLANLEATVVNHSALERLAMFLCMVSRRHSRQGYSARDFRLVMTRQDIANHLGLASETISRLLGQMKDAGVISVHRRHLQILDADALQDLATGHTASLL